MSEFKGTKGKWEVYTPDHIGSTNVKFGRDIWDGFVEIWHHQLREEEAKANALLISKAPEMLEMLILISNIYPVLIEEDKDILREIKKLIKEATKI